MAGLLTILQHGGNIVHVVDDHVEVTVVVEIADREAASHPRNLQAAAGAFRDVTEPRAEVEQDLILLAKGFAKLRELVDVGKDVAVGEEEIELAIEIRVEKRRAPTHPGERRRGNAGWRAHVFEVL